MAVLDAILRVLLHLSEHIADDLGRIVGCLLGSRYLYEYVRFASTDAPGAHSTYIHCDVAQLWPAKLVVHVVLAKVVFGQVRDVGRLDMRDV